MRNTIDKYYTKPEIVGQCLDHIQKHISHNAGDYIIEPSAGNGAFMPGIKQRFNGYFVFLDIEPEHAEIHAQDYLAYIPPPKTQQLPCQIHVIGNPPFGRQSSLAIKFIKKSCEFCDTVSFILPKSFKKDSMKKHFPLNFHLAFEIDLPTNSFLVREEEHDVPCILQIWMKRDHPRIVADKLEPFGYEFVKKSDNPHISFRRVGVNAGAISLDIANKSEQSHYFIRLLNPDQEGGQSSDQEEVETVVSKLSRITFESDNTVGPKSISKQELIHKFNPVLSNPK